MRTNAEIKKDTRRGMRWLDRYYPGWENEVPAGVDIRLSKCCVAAYLTGQPFERAVHTLGIDNPAGLGLYVNGDMYAPEVVEEYAKLTVRFRVGRYNRLQATETTINLPTKKTGELVHA